MAHACCNWCHRFLKVNDTYNPLKDRVYCSRRCLWCDWLFNRWMSDEEINRRRHYDELTEGGDEQESED